MDFEQLSMPDADVRFYPAFFSPEESASLLADLTANIAWKQEQIQMFGKPVAMPRLTAWYGDEGKSYTYSGLTSHPLAWTETLLVIKSRVDAASDTTFNSVLLNLYRDGRDSMGWHSDDEPELGTNPVIASVTFGASRMFQFKHKHNPDLCAAVELTSGSLLIMAGMTQHFWKHQIPKTKQPLPPRINLTFRVIIT